jgi:Suppressor of fused protein (SUFU)
MVELLAIVASYATREDHDGLHDGHTVSIGRPWVEGAEADHLYFNKPYFVSRDFATLRIHDAVSVQFLWLVPITDREQEWRHEHGHEAFEQRLEDHGVTPEDPARRSSV